MPTEEGTANAYALQMDFLNYLSDFLRELTGYVRVLKQDKDNPNIFWESYYKPEEYKGMRFYCSLDCGLKITHGLHQFFNKHLMLGNIKVDRVPRKAGEITRQIFGDLLFEPEKWEIDDVDGFANKALTTQDQLEIFFTNVANSGIRDWSKSILTIQQRTDAGGPIQYVKEPGLLDKLRGGGQRDI